jgi:hypothetical protein
MKHLLKTITRGVELSGGEAGDRQIASNCPEY